MAPSSSYLRSWKDPLEIITPISTGATFPESLELAERIYKPAIELFAELVHKSASSAQLLAIIRTPDFDADTRMSLLKLFRRCVSLVCDTENTKKIKTVSTESIVKNYGHTFKPIDVLKRQFKATSRENIVALAGLLAENDNRGQSGYQLTDAFFGWFEKAFKESYLIAGPRGAGRDIELSTVFSDFKGSYPCDFVIRDKKSSKVVAVGFARYDSTRGGSQSDDRTGGNANKVDKANAYQALSGNRFRIIFLADGPGLAHKDTWEEACILDGHSNDNVRVVTLKIAPKRITKDWLDS